MRNDLKFRTRLDATDPFNLEIDRGTALGAACLAFWPMLEGEGILLTDVAGGHHTQMLAGTKGRCGWRRIGTRALGFGGARGIRPVLDFTHEVNGARIVVGDPLGTLKLVNNFSMFAWVLPRSPGSTSDSAVLSYGTNSYGFHLRGGGSGVRVAVAKNEAAIILNAGGANSIPLNRWSFVGFTLSAGGTGTGYYNAVQAWTGAQSQALAAPSRDLYIGACSESTGVGRNFQGMMAGIYVFQGVLTAAQVLALYQDPFVLMKRGYQRRSFFKGRSALVRARNS